MTPGPEPGGPRPDAPEPETEPDPPAPEGRDRLIAALRHPSVRSQAVTGVLLAVLGFAAVTQVQSNGRDDNYVGARQGDLIQYINSLSLASQRAETEINQLQETRQSLGSDTEARRTALIRARTQAQTLGILAGTVPAAGPGIRAQVTDPATGSGVGTNQMINGLQELRDAGAEVIEINDKVRVVAQTSLADASGGGLVVDGRQLSAPYTIDAIGDPHTLATALDFTGGFISEVRGVGGTVSVHELDTVDIGSVVTPTQPRYAVPGTNR